MLLETCCTSFSREKYVGFAVARGGVCGAGVGGGGQWTFFKFRANGLIYKGYTLQRYSDKKITNSH